MKMFLIGMNVAFLMVAIVFFVRCWRDSRDPLFLRFATAFLILGVERIALIIIQVEREANSFVYILRLIAFSLVIWALIDKNRPRSRKT